MADRPVDGGGRPPEASGWVHVGRLDVYVDESGRVATRPGATEETARAEALAAALRAVQGNPAGALGALEEALKGAEATTESVDTLVKVAHDLLRGPDVATGAKYAERFIDRILRDYRAGRFRDVLRLVRAVLALYLLAEKWRELVALLELDRLSAEQLGDAVEAAQALHDLSVLAGAAGAAPLAAELADQARELLQDAGEHAVEGAGAVQATASVAVPVAAKVAGAVAGVVLVSVTATGFAVGGGGWFGLGGGDKPREGGDAEIVAFAVGDGTNAPGTFSEESGFSPPGGAAGPGETLEACEPTYVYDFTHFENMSRGTDYTTALTRGEDFSKSNAAVWEEPAEFTMAFESDRDGEALPYGAWTLVVEIDGVEVDRESFTLAEAC